MYFNPNSIENQGRKLIQSSFICGISKENIKKLFYNPKDQSVKMDVLFSFPEKKELNMSVIVDFLFPSGPVILFEEESPNYYVVALTNEKGIKSYIYVCLFHEEVNYKEFSTIATFNTFDHITNDQIKVKENVTSQPKFSKLFIPLAFCFKSLVSDIGFFAKIFKEINNILSFDIINFDLNKYFHHSRKKKKTSNTNNNTTKTNSKKNLYYKPGQGIYSFINPSNTNNDDDNEDYYTNELNNLQVDVSKIKVFEIHPIVKYKYTEILNLFIFINNLIRPCYSSLLSINLHFSTFDIYFPSKHEIPKYEKSIKIMMDCLELTTIIKLWTAVLCEKHIIILAKQNLLLFTITNALLGLIFPFKWLHTYIPVLPNELHDFLESPTPYIMGISSLKVDFQSIKEIYPNYVICDINTSQLSCNIQTKLPENEEFKIRTKINFLKNPKLQDIEKIFNEQENNNTSNYNDLEFNYKHPHHRHNLSGNYNNKLNFVNSNLYGEGKQNNKVSFKNFSNNAKEGHVNFSKSNSKRNTNYFNSNKRDNNNNNNYNSSTHSSINFFTPKLRNFNNQNRNTTFKNSNESIKLNSQNFFIFEDVSYFRSFAENIQNIFFRVLRAPLENFDKKYLKGNEFDSQLFLDMLPNNDYKDFWEKVINTAAFEYFILAHQYLDESYTLLFNNIVENEANDIFLSRVYHFNINLPNSINSITNEVKENLSSIENNEEYNSNFIIINKDILKNNENVNIISKEFSNKKNITDDYSNSLNFNDLNSKKQYNLEKKENNRNTVNNKELDSSIIKINDNFNSNIASFTSHIRKTTLDQLNNIINENVNYIPPSKRLTKRFSYNNNFIPNGNNNKLLFCHEYSIFLKDLISNYNYVMKEVIKNKDTNLNNKSHNYSNYYFGGRNKDDYDTTKSFTNNYKDIFPLPLPNISMERKHKSTNMINNIKKLRLLYMKNRKSNYSMDVPKIDKRSLHFQSELDPLNEENENNEIDLLNETLKNNNTGNIHGANHSTHYGVFGSVSKKSSKDLHKITSKESKDNNNIGSDLRKSSKFNKDSSGNNNIIKTNSKTNNNNNNNSNTNNIKSIKNEVCEYEKLINNNIVESPFEIEEEINKNLFKNSNSSNNNNTDRKKSISSDKYINSNFSIKNILKKHSSKDNTNNTNSHSSQKLNQLNSNLNSNKEDEIKINNALNSIKTNNVISKNPNDISGMSPIKHNHAKHYTEEDLNSNETNNADDSNNNDYKDYKIYKDDDSNMTINPDQDLPPEADSPDYWEFKFYTEKGFIDFLNYFMQVPFSINSNSTLGYQNEILEELSKHKDIKKLMNPFNPNVFLKNSTSTNSNYNKDLVTNINFNNRMSVNSETHVPSSINKQYTGSTFTFGKAKHNSMSISQNKILPDRNTSTTDYNSIIKKDPSFNMNNTTNTNNTLNAIANTGIDTSYSVLDDYNNNTNNINNNNNANENDIHESLLELSFNNNKSLRVSLERPSCVKDLVIELPRVDCFQYYNILAYYMEEFNFKNKEAIFNYYLKSAEKDIYNFSFSSYNLFIDKLDIHEINHLIKQILSVSSNNTNALSYIKNIIRSSKSVFHQRERERKLQEEGYYITKKSSNKKITDSKSNTTNLNKNDILSVNYNRNSMNLILNILLLRKDKLKSELKEKMNVKKKNLQRKTFNNVNNIGGDSNNYNNENRRNKKSLLYGSVNFKTLDEEAYNNNLKDDSFLSDEDSVSGISTTQNLAGECKTDAEKILENLKQFNTSNDNYLKKNVINAISTKNYNNILTSTNTNTNKINLNDIDNIEDNILRDSMGEIHIDCLSLTEDICLRLNKVILKFGLEKYKLDSNNMKIIVELVNSEEFGKIRKIVNTLSFLDLKTISCMEFICNNSDKEINKKGSNTNINEAKIDNTNNVPNTVCYLNKEVTNNQNAKILQSINTKKSSNDIISLMHPHNISITSNSQQNDNISSSKNLMNNTNNATNNLNNNNKERRTINKSLNTFSNLDLTEKNPLSSLNPNSNNNNNIKNIINNNASTIMDPSKLKLLNFKLKMKISFWLNLYNYLVIYTILNKKEFISTAFEWTKILKYSYFDIGGLVLSLYEIEQFILRQTNESTKFTDNFTKVLQSKEEYLDILMQDKHSNEKLKFLKFGISYPLFSSPTLRVYFPLNLEERLKVNAYEYLSKNINIDIEQGIIYVPEMLMSIDDQFKENINYYTEILPKNFFKYLQNYQISVTKMDWTLSFENFKNNDIKFFN